METITTNLMVTDMRKSLDFYCGLLGFTLSMGVNSDHDMFTDGEHRDDLIYVMLTHGSNELMLQRRDSLADALITTTEVLRGQQAPSNSSGRDSARGVSQAAEDQPIPSGKGHQRVSTAYQ